MTQAKWNSTVTAPKSANLKHAIITRCKELNISIDCITNEELNGDFLDRLFGNKKEMIYFNLNGTVENLCRLFSLLSIERLSISCSYFILMNNDNL